ncbi:homeobox protein Hox-B6 isoform X1 [Choloepus didactylus]|uniref:homeobox protein Hox-B6 isoform X1 n=1 Tax=Choloepus didactylus TaxID=27675 RepID=UPI00189EF9CF|nr:homeobox protein Hox-B6 isoform X1 [Choloepus didactylus]
MSSYFVNSTFPVTLASGQESFLGQLPLYSSGYADPLRHYPAPYGPGPGQDKGFAASSYYPPAGGGYGRAAPCDYGPAPPFYREKESACALSGADEPSPFHPEPRKSDCAQDKSVFGETEEQKCSTPVYPWMQRMNSCNRVAKFAKSQSHSEPAKRQARPRISDLGREQRTQSLALLSFALPILVGSSTQRSLHEKIEFLLWAQRPARPPDLHALPDAGAGKGVSLQSLPDAAAAHRNRARPVPDGEADQDMVPEPAHEVEKREQTAQRVSAQCGGRRRKTSRVKALEREGAREGRGLWGAKGVSESERRLCGRGSPGLAPQSTTGGAQPDDPARRALAGDTKAMPP